MNGCFVYQAGISQASQICSLEDNLDSVTMAAPTACRPREHMLLQTTRSPLILTTQAMGKDSLKEKDNVCSSQLG